MNILTAAQNNIIGHAAVLYAMEGISVIPLQGKKAVIGWQEYQRRAAQPNTVAGWLGRGLLQNVGIVCGRVSCNLVVIDCDGLEAADLFERTFPALLDTFTVATGSGCGKHYYYFTNSLPQTTRAVGLEFGNIELRSDGCYVVAPPSIHPDTARPYLISQAVQPRNLPDMDTVKDWLLTFRKANPQQQQNTHSSNTSRPFGKASYGERALSGEIERLKATAPGNQNNQLNCAAYKLGQLVAAGHLTTGDIENALLTAALSIGQDEKQSWRTIQSGLRAGMLKPRL